MSACDKPDDVSTLAEHSEASDNREHQCKFNEADLQELGEKIASLQDLFVRRLMEDKQKAELIRTLESGAKFAFIEPFLSDIILLLDRIERTEDDFVKSVRDELLDIMERRGVSKIEVTSKFDPMLNKAVKVTEEDDVDAVCVTNIIRNGYTFSGRVIRAAEVVVVKPKRK